MEYDVRIEKSGPRPPPATRDTASARRTARWQKITLAALFTGYAGYYVCRSNLSVCIISNI